MNEILINIFYKDFCLLYENFKAQALHIHEKKASQTSVLYVEIINRKYHGGVKN